MVKPGLLVGALVAVVLVVPAARAQATYKRELPDSLVGHAKIAEGIAAAAAQKRVPKGTIESVELEREGGKLIYSYDIRSSGKSGVDEVQVSAISGKVVSFEHETPAAEKKEAAAEAKAATKPKPKTP
jgi:Peptidase propeptide and YPEB domain